MNIQNIKINDIFRDEEQPRKYFDDEAMERLTQSIKDNGIESPITVRKNGKGFVIVDGERRWKSSKDAGLKDIPCIVTEKDDILEQQLRSDCLKEGLSADELDQAIYRYWNQLEKSSLGKNQWGGSNNKGYDIVSKSIGKSATRVSMAVDRYEFKNENKEFVKEIEKKHNPEGKPKYSKVNSTIAYTSGLKNKPKVRKAVVEEILNDRKHKKYGIDHDTIKMRIKEIEKRNIDDPEDARAVMKDMKLNSDFKKSLTHDPRYVFQQKYFEFNKYEEDYNGIKFETVKKHLQGKLLKNYIEAVEQHLQNLKSLEE